MEVDETDAEEAEDLLEEDVEWGGAVAYRGKMKIPPKMMGLIVDHIDARIEKDMERKLYEVIQRALTKTSRITVVDSTSIATLICGFVALISGLYSVQLAISGNTPVAEAFLWVVVNNIVGLSILLYAKATRG